MSRTILARCLAIGGLVGIAAVCWILVASLAPASDKQSHIMKVDLSEIPLDYYRVVEWHDKPIVVFRPGPLSAKGLAALNRQTLGPHIHNEQVPPAFVYFKISTNRGCGIDEANSPDWGYVWRDVCHTGTWDRAGRRLSGEDRYGQPLPNLGAPLFRYSNDSRYIELL